MTVDVTKLAHELTQRVRDRQIAARCRLSAREPGFDLAAAYAVEAELARLRRATGTRPSDARSASPTRRCGASLKLDTLVWAHMYDDTVRSRRPERASLSLSRMCAPKIEPEIVFKLRAPA